MDTPVGESGSFFVVSSHYDHELRTSVMADILDMIPKGIRTNYCSPKLSYRTWAKPGDTGSLTGGALLHITIVSVRIQRGATVDKTITKAKLSSFSQLNPKTEQE
ncbi:pre-mRNA-splicing factor 8, partial [Modicella reniformis]